MKNLRIKIKENLTLNPDIDYLLIKNKHTNSLSYDISSVNENKTNKTIIFEIIHMHSNYENIMWNFWKQEKKSCIKEMTNLLFEISKLDRMLTWDCQDVLAYYENDYEKRCTTIHLKLRIVVNIAGHRARILTRLILLLLLF